MTFRDVYPVPAGLSLGICCRRENAMNPLSITYGLALLAFALWADSAGRKLKGRAR